MMRIPNAQVERAAYVIDEANASELLETTMAYKPQGRPGGLSLRTFLIGCLLAIELRASFKATTIHRVLTEGLSIQKQWELGVRQRDDEDEVVVTPRHRIYYLSKTITKRVAYTKMAAAYFDLDVDNEELERRRRGHYAILDALLQASIVDEGVGWYALDGSGHWSWGRSPRKVKDDKDIRANGDGAPGEEEDAPTHADDRIPDEIADRGPEVMDFTPDSEEEEDGEESSRKISYDFDAAMGSKTNKMGGRDPYWGYIIDAACRVRPPGGDPIPPVIERMVVSPASTDVVEPSLLMLDSMLQNGVTVTDIVVDRHYSYKTTERWSDELRAREINQHFDLRSDEHGFKDINGMRLAAGWMHCPATPDHLAEIKRPGFNATEDEVTDFKARIAERFSWAMGRHERTNDDGRSRWMCPAVEGKRGCPLREGTVAVAEQSGLPIVDNPPEPETAPKCCTNASGVVSLRSSVQRKHEQPHYWGNDDWQVSHDLRTYVEGLFGSLKNPDTEGVRRGFTKFRGLPMISLGLVLAAVVCNIRHQRKFWEDRPDRPDHPLLADDAPSYGYIELTKQEAEEQDRIHGNPDEEAA